MPVISNDLHDELLVTVDQIDNKISFGIIVIN